MNQTRGINYTVLLIAFSMLNASISIGLINTVLSPLMRKVGINEVLAGSIVTISSLMWIIGSPFWGYQSEIRGRKTTLILGLLGLSIGLGIFGLATQMGINKQIFIELVFFLFVFSRMITGFMFPAVPVSAQAYIADVTDSKQRTSAMTYLSLANGLGIIMGPALGWIFANQGPVISVYVAAILPLFSVFLLLYFLPKTSIQIKHFNEKPPKLNPFNKNIFPILLVGFIFYLILPLIQVTAGFYFQDKMLLSTEGATKTVGEAFFALGLASIICQFALIRFFKGNPINLLKLGLPLTGIGLTLLLTIPSIPFISFIFIGMASGLIVPGFMSSLTLIVNKNEHGSVAGLANLTQGLGGMLGPIVGTALYKVRPEYPYFLCIALLLIGIYFILFDSRTKNSIHTQAEETSELTVSKGRR